MAVDPNYTLVQAPRGTLVHALAWHSSDRHVGGETLCRRTASDGWKIPRLDCKVSCRRCVAAMGPYPVKPDAKGRAR